MPRSVILTRISTSVKPFMFTQDQREWEVRSEKWACQHPSLLIDSFAEKYLFLFLMWKENNVNKSPYTSAEPDTCWSFPKRFWSLVHHEMKRFEKLSFRELVRTFSEQHVSKHIQTLCQIMKKTCHESTDDDIAILSFRGHKKITCKVYNISPARKICVLYSRPIVRITCPLRSRGYTEGGFHSSICLLIQIHAPLFCISLVRRESAVSALPKRFLGFFSSSS